MIYRAWGSCSPRPFEICVDLKKTTTIGLLTATFECNQRNRCLLSNWNRISRTLMAISLQIEIYFIRCRMPPTSVGLPMLRYHWWNGSPFFRLGAPGLLSGVSCNPSEVFLFHFLFFAVGNGSWVMSIRHEYPSLLRHESYQSYLTPFWCLSNRQVQKGPTCRRHNLDPKGKVSGHCRWEKVGFSR